MTTQLDIPTKHLGIDAYTPPDLTDKAVLQFYGQMTVEQYIRHQSQHMLDNLQTHYTDLLQTYNAEYASSKQQLMDQLSVYVEQERSVEADQAMTDDVKPKKKGRGKK